MKLAVIGGGSTYTPELVHGLVRMQSLLPITELVLQDPARERLEVVGGMAGRMLAAGGHPARLVLTQSLAEAVDGTSAVLVQLRVGGQAARAVDERLPLRWGCLGQETTGFGGLAKALRTVPVVLSIAEEVSRRAPDAWLIDFTNPVGIVTRALLDGGHKALGLCSAAMVFQRHFARVLDVPPETVELDHLGLNHLTFEVGVRAGGREVLGQLVGEHVDRVAPATGLPPEVVARLGVVPSYYLHYFWEHDRVVAHQQSHPSRAEEVAEVERQLLDIYRDPTVMTKPELLSRRGGAFYSEAAVELMASLFGPRAGRHVVNLRNQGALPFLDDEAVVEVPAYVSEKGATVVGGLPTLGPTYSGLVSHVSAYEELALDAARRGGRERVYQALLAHPLIGQTDLAEELSLEMIKANQAFLAWA